MTSSTFEGSQLARMLEDVVPKLSGQNHKGQAGKVAVVGGCREYTGAPFFAAFSALKVGADLSHVFCTNGAATVIKSYSPELIVHPYLPDSSELPDEADEDAQQAAVDRAVALVDKWLPRFDVIVVGPGLGRDELMLKCIAQVVRRVREQGVPMVVDADGLWLLNQDLSLIKGYDQAILTPNKVEFGRLADKLGIALEGNGDVQQQVCQALEGPVVVRKGSNDVICHGSTTVVCDAEGSPRRAGGQGDIVSGCTAVFAAWATKAHSQHADAKAPAHINPLMLAAYGGCLITRHASNAAFAKHKRSMVAGSVIEELGDVMEQLYPAS